MAHSIEFCNSIFRIKGWAMTKRGKVTVNLLAYPKVLVERTYYNYREFKPFGLMDSHQLHVAAWYGIVGVFVFVYTALQKEFKEAVKEIVPNPFLIIVSNNGYGIIILKNSQKLRED